MTEVVISAALLRSRAVPNAAASFGSTPASLPTCRSLWPAFDVRGAADYLDLRPVAAFEEQTRYLDEALHVDARHERVSPPLLASEVRNDMLREFLSRAQATACRPGLRQRA